METGVMCSPLRRNRGRRTSNSAGLVRRSQIRAISSLLRWKGRAGLTSAIIGRRVDATPPASSLLDASEPVDDERDGREGVRFQLPADEEALAVGRHVVRSPHEEWHRHLDDLPRLTHLKCASPILNADAHDATTAGSVEDLRPATTPAGPVAAARGHLALATGTWKW